MSQSPPPMKSRRDDVFVHLVDDDHAIRTLLSRVFAKAGFQVRAYDSADRFMAECDSHALGCVVTDVAMPGLNGVDLVRRLKAQGIGHPVIVMSGAGDVALAVEAMQAGAADFLQKPFSPSALVAKVNAALDGCDLPLMAQMLNAISTGQIEVHYQPKLDLRLGEVTGAEALVRWRRPGGGLVGPDTFIPAAERTGHIRELTQFVLRRAVRDQALMADAGRPLAISVNISGRTLSDPDFAGFAADAVAESRGAICFEVTETAMMERPEQAQAMFDAFALAGIELSIDDFGAGLSSLAYVKTIPAQELKLDRMMVRNVATDERDAAVVEAAIALARRLGMKVTAEGVEDEDCLARLADMGCDQAQGYHIGRPVPLDRFLTLYMPGAADPASWRSGLRARPASFRSANPADPGPVVLAPVPSHRRLTCAPARAAGTARARKTGAAYR